ncbi:MAG: 23S rRNA (guanosine(2251)-2'-O)-methyltransferase RlmB [Peptococcaceae bacterium]|jgi:23S rRNA (guanosine2251-2'-O)-methyltransferase|nr:23S rRNA (guanosine(2251)-2'-O)-methyltransferase RlmB [Peptococcaceae bacterium]
MEHDELIYGKNAVRELVLSGQPLNKVLLQKDQSGPGIQEILGILRERKIPYQAVDRVLLDRLTEKKRHQGILAYAAPKAYADVEEMLSLAVQRQEDPCLVLLDQVEDPHNLGAVIRSLEAVGAHGVIIPKRRSVALTGTVAKTSAGALEYVPVARVSNLVQTLNHLKQAGCWVIGAEPGGAEIYDLDLTGPLVIVLGGEGKGISRLVREHCDGLVSIPMCGKINSLNVSVATSIVLYEVFRQRRAKRRELVKTSP